jgi:malonate transporter and related proteins
MSTNVLEVTGPVYLLIGLGYVAVRRGWMAAENVRALGRFVIQFCVPAMLVRTLAHAPLSTTLQVDFIGPYLIGSLVAMGTVLALSKALLRRPMSLAGIQALGASSSNSMFIGFPILHQLVGAPAALALALVQVVENLVMIPLGLILSDAQGGRHPLDALRATLRTLSRNPMIQGIVVGVLISATGLTLPGPLDKALGMLVGAAAPTALFVIGGSLVGLHLGSMKLDLVLVAGGKLMLHPLCVGLVLLFWAPADPVMRTCALMFAAMPMMSVYPMLGQPHGHDRFCAGALLAATVGSFITLNALIALLPVMFPGGWR